MKTEQINLDLEFAPPKVGQWLTTTESESGVVLRLWYIHIHWDTTTYDFEFRCHDMIITSLDFLVVPGSVRPASDEQLVEAAKVLARLAPDPAYAEFFRYVSARGLGQHLTPDQTLTLL